MNNQKISFPTKINLCSSKQTLIYLPYAYKNISNEHTLIKALEKAVKTFVDKSVCIHPSLQCVQSRVRVRERDGKYANSI